MMIFPYKNVVIETEYGAEGIYFTIQKACKQIDWLRFDEPNRFENNIYNLENNSFKLIHKSTYYKRPKIIIKGKVMEIRSKNFIELKIRWSVFGIMFYLYMHFFSLAAFIFLIQVLMQDKIEIIPVIVLPFFILLPYLNLYLSFSKSLDYMISEILDLFNGKLCKK